jgi:hypothetical protein
MMRTALVTLTLLGAGSAAAEDCKRFTDVIYPVSVNFAGIPTTHMTDTWRVLSMPVLGADNCTVLRKGELQRNRAAVHCIWQMTKATEQQARAAYDAWAKPLLACRADQRTTNSSTPKKPLELERLITKDAQDNEAWVVSLSRSEGAGWVVGVMGAVRDVKGLTPVATSSTPTYRPATVPPIPQIKTVAPSTSVDCKPLQEMTAMARSGREAPGAATFGDIDNRTELSRKYFSGQGCTGTSRSNAPGAYSVTCSTLGLNADHRYWSKRVAAERASLVAACFPGFRRMNSRYGAWFTSPDGTLEVTATWNEQTGFSMVETNVSYTPPK